MWRPPVKSSLKFRQIPTLVHKHIHDDAIKPKKPNTDFSSLFFLISALFYILLLKFLRISQNFLAPIPDPGKIKSEQLERKLHLFLKKPITCILFYYSLFKKRKFMLEALTLHLNRFCLNKRWRGESVSIRGISFRSYPSHRHPGRKWSEEDHRKRAKETFGILAGVGKPSQINSPGYKINNLWRMNFCFSKERNKFKRQRNCLMSMKYCTL